MTAPINYGLCYRQFPLWCDSTHLLAELENEVRHFAHDHKYTVGRELPRQAMGVPPHATRPGVVVTGFIQETLP